MENRKRYALVTILNDKFVLPAKVMLYSFFCNNPWFDGDVVVMSSDDDLKNYKYVYTSNIAPEEAHKYQERYSEIVND